MVYDLVRGLDSERGELELNVLALVRHSPTGARLEYAPEIEWAFADGYAIELELPFDGGHLEAWKFAVQGTLGLSARGHYAHGWQLLAEIAPSGQHGLVAAKWIGSIRLGERSSVVSMFGGRAIVDAVTRFQGLANVNLFYAVSEQVTLGIEFNGAFDDGPVAWLLMPQVHVQLNHHFRLQMGLGAVGFGTQSFASGSMRMIVEL